MHFAGLKAVGESVGQPLRYYRVNLTGSINLLEVSYSGSFFGRFHATCSVLGVSFACCLSTESFAVLCGFVANINCLPFQHFVHVLDGVMAPAFLCVCVFYLCAFSVYLHAGYAGSWGAQSGLQQLSDSVWGSPEATHWWEPPSRGLYQPLWSDQVLHRRNDQGPLQGREGGCHTFFWCIRIVAHLAQNIIIVFFARMCIYCL